MQTELKYNIGASKNQGLLEVFLNLDNNQLFIECSEVMIQWDDPEYAIKAQGNCSQEPPSKWNVYQNARYATWEEIVGAGWDKYVVNKP